MGNETVRRFYTGTGNFMLEPSAKELKGNCANLGMWLCEWKKLNFPTKINFCFFFAYDIERSLKTTKGAKTWGTPSQQINISLQSRALVQRFLLQCELNQIYIAQIKALSGKNLWQQIRNPFQSTTLKWMKTHSVYKFSIKKGDMRCFWFFLFFV